MMFDILKKTVYTGMGLAYMTTDKVQQIAKDLANRAKLSEEEGRKFAQELLNQSAEARSAVEAKTAQIVSDTLKKLNLPTRDDVAALEARIAELEASITGAGESEDAETDQ